MTTAHYINNLNTRYKLGHATEHTFRGDLQQLLESLVIDVTVTNEPKRQSCGAPDYILTRRDIPIGFIEAKDIGDNDLEGKKKTGNKEQFDRYKASLNNLIFTDYLDFHLYQNGEFVTRISIGELTSTGIKPLSGNFAAFENLIKDFCTHVSQSIKSSKRLAEMMASKARLLADIIGKALTSDEITNADSTLKDQMEAFKNILIHDITPKQFADVYAQTIAYGMFAARLHDPTLDTFSRQEAAELIPKSNPFLRKLFGYIAGPDIDDRIKWIVDNLIEIFLACNVEEILKNYGKATKMEDPIIHFYETFLAEYDPKLRKARGVWYTPAPVVNFIVRAVDDTLKKEFGLKQGLADTSKTTIKVKRFTKATADRRSKTKEVVSEEEVHKVQILDPATGTGTFLSEVIKLVYKKFKGQEGIWSGYVEKDLLPRLNGFELLMASYAMAHLKIDLLLKETGYDSDKNQRTKIYLTNSLEESHPDTGTLFSSWLSNEANEANHIKRDTPVMCVIGNPPYSGISSNNGEWISNLIEDYKYVKGVHFNERKHWLNDDYVKFLRYGQYFIEKNGSGILAFINPHGFLDNPTFRGMRWHLLKTFDTIYTIDLHGNSKKKETAPDGSIDVNVFDIQQGVSINVFVKTGKKKTNELGRVYHFDLYGRREFKYDFLSENHLGSIDFKELEPNSPYYFFQYKNEDGKESYNLGFSINELFVNFTSGMVTANDALSVFKSEQELENTTRRILDSENPFLEFNIKDSRRVNKEGRLNDLRNASKRGKMTIHFRPFDFNYMYQFDKNEHWINSPRIDIMKHFIDKYNIGLVVAKQCADNWKYVLCTRYANDFNLTGTAGRYGSGYTFPLYLYPERHQKNTEGKDRTLNLNDKILKQIDKQSGLKYRGSDMDLKNGQTVEANSFSAEQLFDYIYAVLHSPTYREKYKEFLKVDFPRVPYPKPYTFYQFVELGRQLKEIHLMQSENLEELITSYPQSGTNVITTKIGKADWELYDTENNLGRIWINEEQYFDKIPLVAWEFYIGGYQPAQKWLKDRKGRILDHDDIFHYQRIIVALTETDRIMKEIDRIEIE